jgi:hypothetical protein
MSTLPSPSTPWQRPASRAEIPGSYRFIGLATLFLTSCFALLFILINGSNVFFNDELHLLPLIKAARLGRLTFDALWTPLNDHRPLVLRVTYIIMDQTIGLNLLAMMVLSWSIITGTALFLFQRLTAVFDFSKKRLWLALAGLCNLALFSPIQWENWLWAFQLGFFLVQAGAILSLFTVSCVSMNFVTRLMLAIFCAAVASLSLAQGLMLFPSLIIAILLTEATRLQKLIAVLMLCICAAVLYWAYFTNYRNYPHVQHFTLHEILKKPRTPFLYFAGLLGAPVAFWAPETFRLLLAIVAGCILLLAFCLFSYLNLRKDSERKQRHG